MEFLNEKKFFDFTEPNTIERVILALVVAIVMELLIRRKKKST